MKVLNNFIFSLFQAFEITIDVVSGRNAKWKANNLSGRYHIIDIVNERPAYKVGFNIVKNTLIYCFPILYLRETRRLIQAKIYTFGSMKKRSHGISQVIHLTKLKMNCTICIQQFITL